MIFYENKRAEELLKPSLISYVSFDDVVILAKYFKRMGKNRPQIKKSIIDFYEKHNPNFNEILARDCLNNGIKAAYKFGLRFPIDVRITEDEINTIRNAGNYKRQKVLFTMLVLAKYYKNNNTKLNNVNLEAPTEEDVPKFYVNEKITTILKLAKVNISKKERNTMAYELQQQGLIVGIRTEAYRICFVDDNSPVSIIVTDMNSLIDFYPWYCESCGRVIEKRAKRHNLCLGCYKEKRRCDDRVRKY